LQGYQHIREALVFKEEIDGGRAAVYDPVLGFDSAVIVIGEGVLISSRPRPLPSVARRDAGQSPFA
jgi:hypothetical protein